MIDEQFCTLLEIAIMQGLPGFSNKEIQDIVPDGIINLYDPTDVNFSKKFVNDNRYIILRIWTLAPDIEYKLILLLGNKALSRYARGLDLLSCIPDEINENNMRIDIGRVEIVVVLL